MTDAQTTVLYALSTLAQTCAALAAFVGAVGIFRLQVLRDQRTAAEQEFRVVAARVTSVQELMLPLPLQEVIEGVEKARLRAQEPENRNNIGYQANVNAAEKALARSRALDQRSGQSRRPLMIFEAWNLLLIGAALVGFNYVPPLATWPGMFWVVWLAAVGTVAVTGFCVFAWTKG